MNEISQVMPKKRKLSIDETAKVTANTCLQSCMRKAKKHRDFDSIFGNNTVLELKDIARKMGNKSWYSLRKKNLVCSIIVYNAAKSISSFFEKICNKKRISIIKNCDETETCPISLALVKDLDDPYLHDGVIFSQNFLEEYFLKSYDFVNPITRKPLTMSDIRRFHSKTLLESFKNKDSLRKKYVESTNHFSFLEMDIENIMITLLQLYNERATEEYDEHVEAFENTFRRMRSMDKTRTLCTMESLVDRAEYFHPRIQKWGMQFVGSYINRLVHSIA